MVLKVNFQAFLVNLNKIKKNEVKIDLRHKKIIFYLNLFNFLRLFAIKLKS